MTSITIVLNSGMCANDWIEAMIKAGVCPGILRMTALTIRWELCGRVIRIRRLVVIRRVTADTSVWCIIIIAVMTGVTVIFDGHVRTLNRVEAVVVKAGRNPGIFRMTAGAIHRELGG